MKFYLGTHRPHWLWDEALAGVPLFVSHRTLGLRKGLRRAVTSWALDSGGFSELSIHGKWVTTLEQYVAAVGRYAEEIGSLDWAAPMDWMTEPFMLEKTGLSLEEHQERTVQNYLDLQAKAPELPFIPVLQGWELEDYHRCVDLYASAGVDLTTEKTVGVGSVCRRQHLASIAEILSSLTDRGIRIHGFGVKTQGLKKAGGYLESADSMSWSFRARRDQPLAGCTHRNCANCIQYALRWRKRVLSVIEEAG